ncbi:TetR/AcrR family transcriptional regulator [Stackebrandtia nassauensis]|uniref:Transcriptional regulator, TetR family n=1 Tax=Stackebrandtia nassauensis (strain DSM 44728 / CIP 108903 / NRRL B-16338 / NBRC 102104 / LLR-40K-21) TaxID=446470 RepID=D3Q783_STANL|nr:TetR/AcrR family transcriptional regulator [Stackebrandtia nassauensis]ADD42354.1 transcriptional regulator, TetR family [Stackebrandtia nassauensis DSM 44728]
MTEGSDELTEPAKRRRGKELEAAILAAAWEELLEVGYSGFHIENVAARAQTGKAVLYRRWSSRAELVLAVVSSRAPDKDEVPNTGDLRTDVIALMTWMAGRLLPVGRDVTLGLVSEVYRNPELSERLRALIVETFQHRTMGPIIDRAVERGQVDRDRVTLRVVTLPIDLMRNDMLLYGTASEDSITEIVDQIFLPVIGYRGRTDAG